MRCASCFDGEIRKKICILMLTGAMFVIFPICVLNTHFFFKVNCSSSIEALICYAFAPPCTHPDTPCRSLCEHARSGCESLMNKFGFQWPETLACRNFPEEDCIRPKLPSNKTVGTGAIILFSGRVLGRANWGQCFRGKCGQRRLKSAGISAQSN